MKVKKNLPPVNQEAATKVLKFIGRAMARPFMPIVAEVDALRARKVIDIKEYFTKSSIVARTLPAPTGHDVVNHATEVKVKELTAKYQPIVDKQLASRFPNLGSARQDLVNSVTQQLVDRQLFT